MSSQGTPSADAHPEGPEEDDDDPAGDRDLERGRDDDVVETGAAVQYASHNTISHIFSSYGAP